MDELTLREAVAADLLVALVSNPARYEDMKELIKSGATQEEVTEKNVNKAFLLADAFLLRCKKGKHDTRKQRV